MALEILTPQEQAVLDSYRRNLVPAALKPGEFPAPPEGAPLPKTPDLSITTKTASPSSVVDSSVGNEDGSEELS